MLPQIQFVFSSKEEVVFSLDPTNYVLDYNGNCILLINPTDDSGPYNNSVILGYSFLSGFYAAFDLEQGVVGISPVPFTLSSATIMDPEPPGPGPNPNPTPSPQPATKFPVWAIIIIVLAVVLTLLGIFYFLKLQRNKKLS